MASLKRQRRKGNRDANTQHDLDEDVGLAVLKQDDNPMPDEPKKPAPKETAKVVSIHEPEITVDRFLGPKGKMHSIAFKAEVHMKDNFRTVKRTRAAWEKLYEEFLTKPRH